MALPARPPLPALLAALLAATTACKGPILTPSRPTLRDREAACAPVWQKVHAEIDASPACSADWECRQIRPEYLGCDAWANPDYQLSEGRLVDLENGCAAISFAPNCGEIVGACVAGRCTGRARVVDAAACVRAKRDLESRLATPTSCRDASDCATVMARGLRGPGPADWATRYAGTKAAIEEACTPDGDGPLPATLPVPTCVAERCQLQPGDEVPRPPAPPATMPRFADPACTGNSIRLPRAQAGAAESMAVSFMVSTRGVPHAFRFEGISREDLKYDLAEAICACTLIPGTANGAPAEMGLRLPLRVKR